MSDSGTPGQGAGFCSKCGAPLAPDAAFCARCGNPVAPSRGPTSPPPTWDRRAYRDWRRQQRWQGWNEKNEKQEKQEKHEKGRGGGSYLGPIMGALILIWLGITLYLGQINLLPSSNWWAYFIAGIGIIIIIQGVARYLEYRGPYLGSVIGGAILFIIGASFVTNVSANFWPLILVIIGVALLASAWSTRRNRPIPSGTS